MKHHGRSGQAAARRAASSRFFHFTGPLRQYVFPFYAAARGGSVAFIPADHLPGSVSAPASIPRHGTG